MVRSERNIHAHLMRETKGGALPFRPAPRTRSESSFSEFHYDITNLPSAGVPSARIHHHHPKQCTPGVGIAQRSNMYQVMEHSKRGDSEEIFPKDKMDGARVDPASKQISAGDISDKTRSKVTLLTKHDLGDPTKGTMINDKNLEPRRARGYILDIQRKARTVCSPENRNPLEVPAKPYRFQKRNAYGHCACGQTWSWNDCAETKVHSPFEVLQGMRPWEMKMHTSPTGVKKYNVCGVQDMLPAGTNTFTKSDAPPSAWHLYENDKKYLSAFERGATPKAGGGSNYLLESSDMWSCMTGRDRPYGADHRGAAFGRVAPGQSFQDVRSNYSEGGSYLDRTQGYNNGNQRVPMSPSLASLRSLSARSLQSQNSERLLPIANEASEQRPRWR